MADPIDQAIRSSHVQYIFAISGVRTTTWLALHSCSLSPMASGAWNNAFKKQSSVILEFPWGEL